MAYIRRLSDGAYVDRNGTAIGRKQLNRLTPEQAIAGAVALTAAGTPCRAHDSAGGLLQSPEASTATVDETINWTGILWRITPAKLQNGSYLYSFRDAYSGEVFHVIGKTPQEVVDRLQIPSPKYQAHIASLIVAGVAPQIVSPVQPTPPAPAAQPPTPGRVLRPGSSSLTELPERRTPESTPATDKSEVFAKWYASASAAQVKEQMRINPEFYAWMNS